VKTLKLALAASTTAAIILLYFFLSDRDSLRRSYLCWKQATSIAACYRGGSIDFVVSIDGFRYEGRLDNAIDNDIFYYGAYEKPILYLLRDVMSSLYSNQGTFVDIGANTGQHSLFMSRYAKAVHSFEPWEPVLKRFRRMVENNGIHNITIHPFGLGDRNLKKPFYRPSPKNLGTGSFIEEFNADNSFEGDLEIRIGDDAMATARIDAVAVIKMDIEGYEKPALKGLQRTLKKNRPVVVFELSTNPRNPVRVKNQEELIALFPENYDFLVIDERSDRYTGTYHFQAFNVIHFDASEHHDVLAYPMEKKHFIVGREAMR
jgi:FkbM family methyltransferase